MYMHVYKINYRIGITNGFSKYTRIGNLVIVFASKPTTYLLVAIVYNQCYKSVK